MNKHLAPVALSVGLLGLVGGVAAAHAFQPASQPAKVRFVQPAAQTVTPSPSTTTAIAVAPKRVVVAPKPVQSVKAKAPARAPIQRQAVMAPADPVPAPDVTHPAGSAADSMARKMQTPPSPAPPPPPTP